LALKPRRSLFMCERILKLKALFARGPMLGLEKIW
jgi:hypothetical protein